MHIYATKHGQICRKIVFCAPLLAERRIASIFDFLFTYFRFLVCKQPQAEVIKSEVRFAFKKTFFDHFCSTRFIFFDVFVLPEFSVLLLGGNFDNSWFVDDPCGPVALFNDPDNPGLVSFLFLNVLKKNRFEVRTLYPI